MRYRTLGRTGLKVSILGFGASPLGGVFGEVSRDEAVQAVHAALDLGVNFFDCSPYYGLTKAETQLGHGLRGIARERYVLATKVGRYGATREHFDFSAKRVAASVDESLARLGCGHIDLIQCHDIEFGSLDQIVDETLPALRRLRDAGKVRFIGITGLPLKALRYVLDRADVDVVLSYCHYALNDTSFAAMLPALEQKELGIISASPLSMGLLTRGNPPAWHPAPAEVKEACRRAAEHCTSRGADIAELAVRFALGEERIDTTLVGIAGEEQLRRSAAWCDGPADPVLLKEVAAILAPVKDRTWSSGRAENN